MKHRLFLALIGIALAVVFRRRLSALFVDGLTKTSGTWIGAPR